MIYVLIYVCIGAIWWLINIRLYISALKEMYLALDENGKTHFVYKAIFTIIAVFLTFVFYPGHIGQKVFDKFAK